jgi:hypothetical protein
MEKKLSVSFRDPAEEGKVILTSDPHDNEMLLLDVSGAKIFIKILDLEECITEIRIFNGTHKSMEQHAVELIDAEIKKAYVDTSPEIKRYTNDFLDCKVELGKVSGTSDEDLEAALINNSIPATIFNKEE